MLILMFWLQATFRKNWQLQVQFCNSHNKGLWDPGGTDVCMYACMYIRLIGLMLLTMTLLLCRPKGFQRVSCHIRATTISSFMVWMILFALDSAQGHSCALLCSQRDQSLNTHTNNPPNSLSLTHILPLLSAGMLWYLMQYSAAVLSWRIFLDFFFESTRMMDVRYLRPKQIVKISVFHWVADVMRFKKGEKQWSNMNFFIT